MLPLLLLRRLRFLPRILQIRLPLLQRLPFLPRILQIRLSRLQRLLLLVLFPRVLFPRRREIIRPSRQILIRRIPFPGLRRRRSWVLPIQICRPS